MNYWKDIPSQRCSHSHTVLVKALSTDSPCLKSGTSKSRHSVHRKAFERFWFSAHQEIFEHPFSPTLLWQLEPCPSVPSLHAHEHAVERAREPILASDNPHITKRCVCRTTVLENTGVTKKWTVYLPEFISSCFPPLRCQTSHFFMCLSVLLS